MVAELLELNERWNRAWFEKDAATVELLAADDYIYIGASGFVLDRDGILRVIRSPSYRLDGGSDTEVVVRPLGREAAVVRHRWRGSGSSEGTSFTDDHRGVRVWEKQGSQWRLVVDQCSFSSSE